MVLAMRVTLVSVMVAVGCSSGAPASQPPARAPAPSPPVAPAAAPAPEREDFETAAQGKLPPDWVVVDGAKDARFAAAPGDTGTVLQLDVTGNGTGSIKRPLDVARYRGKRVLISARGRCDPRGPQTRASIGVDVSRKGPRGFGDRARTPSIESRAWQDYLAMIDVAGDATRLELVVSASGASTVRVDDIAITVLGDAGAGDEPPRALEGRALDNVVAFARLYGIVRYFHPSDEAAALAPDAWERFVVRGVRTVEDAGDAAALRARLEALFAPIAPAVAIHVDGEAAPAFSVTGPAVRWHHRGIDIGPPDSNIYRSVRGSGPDPSHMTITTPIDPALVRGKAIQVTVRAHGTLDGDKADAGLWIEERKAGGQQGFYTEPEMQAAVGAGWTEIAVAGQISSEVTALELGVQVIGHTEAWFEEPRVVVDGKPMPIAGWGTRGTELAPAWTTSSAGFALDVGGKGCDRRRTCLHAIATEAPHELRPWTGALGGGVAASVPLELSTQGGKTVPRATAALPATDTRPLVAGDRATRLAAVIIAWNVFEHFYPYFDVRGTDWQPELPRRLGEAARDVGPAALLTTLRRLVHELHDGHGFVSHAGEDLTWTVPLLWARVEGKVVITQVSEQCACDLAPGDIVTAIDGVPIDQAVAASGALISAATEQWRDDRAVRTLRRGPEGSRRALAVERNGSAHQVDVALVSPAPEIVEKRPATGDEVAPGIRYVDINHVTMEQWTKVMPDLAAARGIIVDLRGYPSRLPLADLLANVTRTPLHSPQWHLPIPTRPDRDGMTFEKSDWAIQPARPFLGNVVFLTDGRAVSAAETYMGIIEHYKLGPIVGATTAGTNGNVNPFTVPGGYSLSWTGLKVLKHDGSRHHGVGIAPTIPAQRTLAGVAARRDEVLERGIEVAKQRSAGAGRAQRK